MSSPARLLLYEPKLVTSSPLLRTRTSTGEVAPQSQVAPVVPRQLAAWIGGNFLRNRFHGRPQITAIAWSSDEDGITFWTVIETYVAEVVDEIIAAEQALGSKMGPVDVDYRTVFADGKPAAAVLPSSAQVLG